MTVYCYHRFMHHISKIGCYKTLRGAIKAAKRYAKYRSNLFTWIGEDE